jgi:endonuclease G
VNPRRYRQQLDAATKRWHENAEQRDERAKECAKPLGDRNILAIDTRERIVRRLVSKGMTAEAEAVEEWRHGDEPLPFDPHERILDDDELVSATTLYQGAALTHCVGRVVVRIGSGRIVGFGTGFLVSDRLLLTNNHVLDSVVEARPSTVEFCFWEDATGRRGRQVAFRLEPDVFFETHRRLDFTLVAVARRGEEGVALDSLGRIPLIAESGKSTVGEPVNIIQHPGGEPQQVVLRENQIRDVVLDFLHYVADTRPGSSGSPVFNVDWELAALHHAGVPARDDDGRILLRDGRVWNGDRRWVDQIDWRANEGVRISSIVADLRQRSDGWQAARQRLFDACFAPSPRFDDVVPGIGSPRTAPATRRTVEAEPPDLFERIDRDYDNRKGYRESFLGSGDFRIPLPGIGGLADADDGRVLDYQNFSVVMNRERRLAWLTGVNIHGRLLERIPRSFGQTRWVFDTRLPRSEQLGNDLYRGTEIDRGHLVRRLDPAWGNTFERALRGNNDTFHYTNAAPMLAEFNEDDDAWAGLEDYILDTLDERNRKATVFTGPIFRADDPLFESPDEEVAAIPRRFWKVLVFRRAGALLASAYVLGQADLLDDFLEDFGDGGFRTFQLSIADLEAMTDLDFGALRDGDSFVIDDESLLLEGRSGRRFRWLHCPEDAAI